jgi:hypothetical protein
VKRWRDRPWLRAAATFVFCALCLRPAFSAAPHMTLSVDLDPATRRLSAVAELVAGGDVVFPLYPGLEVQSALIDDHAAAVVAVSRGEGRKIWRVAARPGAKLRIQYAGLLPALDPNLDYRSVLGSLPPMTSPKGTFLPAGSAWYPQPGAAFAYTVKLRLPASQRGLVPGRLVSETLPSGPDARYAAQFEFPEPAEGIDLMAGPYVVREMRVARANREPLRLRTYFYPELDELSDGYLTDSARYIELYSERIGEYPYSEFSVVAGPLPTGFGMPTLTYMGTQVLKLPFIRATSLGHEVLHNWWGNGVYPDYAKGNWSEGLTTFMADYYYRERESPDAAKAMRLSWLRDFAALPPGSEMPLVAFRSRTHGAEAAVGYGKSAMLFFMLLDIVGEDVFQRAFREFRQLHRFRVASWDDLQRAFEQTSGRSLAVFFDQWLRRAGGPQLAVSDARAHTRRGRPELTLTLTQSAPAYTLEVPVEIAAKGRVEVRRVALDRERQHVTLTLDHAPERVRADPDLRLWRKLDRRELPPILREWILARSPKLVLATQDPNVRAAAQALARSFFENASESATLAQTQHLDAPTLLVGLHDDVDAALASMRLPPRPTAVPDRGSAQVWTMRDPAQRHVAVVSAKDADALRAIATPLPHYGAQSFLVFDGARAIDRGVWPFTPPYVAVTAGPQQ